MTEGPAGRSLQRGYFDDFYAAGAERAGGAAGDPWGFTSRWYEQRKRAVTLAALPRPRFARAFEPGCSIGVLSAELALRCDDLLSADIAAAPLVTARARLDADPRTRHARTAQLQVPAEWPEGAFDLVVLSEVGYYCDEADLRVLVDRATAGLADDGVLVACHWRHPVADYPLRGDAVHEVLRARSGLDVLVEHVEEDFRLDVLVRPPATSVARAAGLV